jgi:hypothetical protein
MSGQTEAPPHQQEEAYRSYLGLPDQANLMLQDGLDTDDAIGAQVLGPDGGTIGSITDLLVDEAGRVVRAIVDVGAAVGAGSKPVAVEIDRLRRAEDNLVLDMGAERLAALPAYRQTGNRWVRDR